MARSSTTFKKGEVTNPKGRPKTDPEIEKLLSSKCLWAIKGVIKLAETSEDEGIILKSLQYLIDRKLGKAPQAINLGDADGAPFQISVVIKRAEGKS